jgi:hypothetical protein
VGVFIGVARRMEEHGDELWRENGMLSIVCDGRRRK